MPEGEAGRRLRIRTDRSAGWRLAVPGLILVGCMLISGSAADSLAPQDESDISEAAKRNALCTVCHFDLLDEEITKIHLTEAISCTECHGPSTDHMHDEMLMTKPDRLYGRVEVALMCTGCHEEDFHHDQAAVEAFRKEWLGRSRPNGRVISTGSICTDCHGTHNIVRESRTEKKADQAQKWIPVFNKSDLSGWHPSGGAAWSVESGRIKAAPGPEGRSGDLWTDAVYEDFLLSTTFRVSGDVNAGIWLRSVGRQGPRIEILESDDPPAFTGSVLLSGKGLALANLNGDLSSRETWNTLSARVEGDRIQVWLNGEEIGSVRTKIPARGRIGLHVESRPGGKGGQVLINELLVMRLDRGEPSNVKTDRAFVPLFNGKDLAGWKAEGGAEWTVKGNCIVGGQGEGNAPGDLLTEAAFSDFVLKVTYRVEWPCNTGIWFRYQSARQAYQADILEYRNPECYSGTLYCTGKMFLAMNEDTTIVNRDTWNTMVVRAEGDHVQTWINNRLIADVHDDTSGTGRIGFQVHAGAQFGAMKIVVREVLIRDV